jgi:hypothetical protein
MGPSPNNTITSDSMGTSQIHGSPSSSVLTAANARLVGSAHPVPHCLPEQGLIDGFDARQRKDDLLGCGEIH